MYRIVKDGTSLGITEAPTYARQAENGCCAVPGGGGHGDRIQRNRVPSSGAGRIWGARRA